MSGSPPSVEGHAEESDNLVKSNPIETVDETNLVGNFFFSYLLQWQ